MNGQGGTLFGVDLGGTKIEGIVVDASDPARVAARRRIATEAQRGYESIVARCAELVRSLAGETGVRPERVGFATPGTTGAAGLLKNSNTQCLNGRPLARDLSAALGVPALLANDANCFALAEARLGAARGGEVVFGVIMGTGVGGGVVVGGRALAGRHGIAGEWGHNVLVTDGEPCYCGKRGCVETVISGPALERFYAERSGAARPLAEIAERARSGGDDAAHAAIEHLVSSFGRAIAAVINILDPDVVVLGGGVSNVEELAARGREAALPYVFNPELETKFVRNELGDSAGVFGAALLSRS